MKDSLGTILRIITIIFMGLAGAMNLLGGIGTVCAAFLTEQFPPMLALLDYQWLYQTLMIMTILIGLAGVWTMIRLTKGGETVYRDALIVLVVGTVVGAVHYFASLTLRGKAAPANVKLYLNILTLLLFLLLRLPGIRDRVDFGGPADKGVGQRAAGLTAIIVGSVVLTTHLWVGGSHVYEGVNWTHVLGEFLSGCGLTLIASGILMLITPLRRSLSVRSSVTPQ
jgi:hypothetical protein